RGTKGAPAVRLLYRGAIPLEGRLVGKDVMSEPSKRAILATVVRRSGPHLVEATLVPGVLFYGCLVAVGLGAAYVAVLSWAYAAVVRRIARRDPVPPILVLSVIGITMRTLVAVVSRSSFVYFLQPVLGSVVMGGVFLVSVALGRPLIATLAGEFWPITPEAHARPGVLRLFRRLTLLWAGVNLASAVLTMALLLSLPLGPFLAMKQLCGLGLTAAAVFLTVSMSLRTARREGLCAGLPPVPLPIPAVLTDLPYEQLAV
ncbi:MAG: hypothetical protein QOE80_4365, partial [Actinomycetota bacterium]|nr:hypothetical protein [Actinomycetota bacterium]